MNEEFEKLMEERRAIIDDRDRQIRAGERGRIIVATSIDAVFVLLVMLRLILRG